MQSGRVCFFVGDISLGAGTERAVATIASGLAARGWRVTILCMKQGSLPFFELHPEIQVLSILQSRERVRWRLAQILWRIRSVAKSVSADVWIDAETVLSAYSVPALVGLPIRHLAWENFHLKEDLGSWIRTVGRAAAAYFCQGVVVLTQADRKAWHAKFGVGSTIHRIPHCVQDFATASEQSLSQRKPIILAVGRHTDQKGFDRLLHAWAKVCSKYPGWRVRIVGSGELTHELQQLSQTLHIQSQVEWVAATANVQTHFSEASVYALSSRFEGFGIVLIEALTHGLPVVSFLCEHGPDEIIIEDQCGLLVENGHLEAFSLAIEKLLADDQDRRRLAIGALARSTAFSPQRILGQWEEILQARG